MSDEKWEPVEPVHIKAGDRVRIIGRVKSQSLAEETFIYEDGATYERLVVPVTLPTEPYTVIAVQWRDAATRSLLGDILLLDSHGVWLDGEDRITADDVGERITGFKVLSRPVEAVTREIQEAVLEAIRSMPDWYEPDTVAMALKERWAAQP